jgi:hypothetical protein
MNGTHKTVGVCLLECPSKKSTNIPFFFIYLNKRQNERDREKNKISFIFSVQLKAASGTLCP